MSEEEYFEQLCSSSVDGTLTESEREKLEAHLAECPSCAALKRDLEQMRALLETETAFPEGLHGKIMERVRQEGRLRVVQPEKPVRRMPALTMVAAAAVVLLVVLGGGAGSMFGMFSGVGTSGADTVTAEALPAPTQEMQRSVQDAAGRSMPSADGADTAAQADAAPAESAPVPADAGAAPAAREAAPYSGAPTQTETAETPAGSVNVQEAAPRTAEPSAVGASALPAALNGVQVAHCYLASGAGELPDIGGELLSSGDGVSYFLLDSSMDTIQNTFKALEDAGFTVAAYEDTGLTLDSKAERWLLIAAEE